ncbi:prepilin-type N-terminal cleavage/methylation domain-containing protein [Deinococcus taeanensis]|uniref:pilus assembly FimT family protein n=1 Tax=Deinococcus taeanensis TaxID=2737050 RepID=UPI001CDBE043|nr:prepilin-type N-terminal cleavage/methylation domain-containing protein [Deinococcus taeanensis]UBV42653.1 prepilin-type N-terminal cleavage/methylation domain-containing protein [Deinococcus taeanensis]
MTPARPALQGFTLLEALLVLSILGIMLGVGAYSMLAYLGSRQLQEGSAQLASDLERVRSGALRYNTSATFELLDARSYRLTINGAAVTAVLPYNLTLQNAPLTLTYSAPYSELSSAPVTLLLRHPRTTRTAQLRTVGVTGKVVQDGS